MHQFLALRFFVVLIPLQKRDFLAECATQVNKWPLLTISHETAKKKNATNKKRVKECEEIFTVGGLRIEFERNEKEKSKNVHFLALHFDLSLRIWSHNLKKEFSHATDS